MRVASFVFQNEALYGIEQDDAVLAASPAFRARFPGLKDVLEAGALEELPANCSERVSPDRFLPPIPNPAKILCVGVNYLPHIREMGREPPEYPLLFVRFADSLTGHGQPLRHPGISEKYDFEGELAVVIGKACHRIDERDVSGVIAGYTPFMDGSVRDWQRHTSQFIPGKNFPASGAAGPWLTSAGDIEQVEDITLETTVNGEVMQSAKISDLVFGLSRLVAYCAEFTPLKPGDMIVTGTPGGVGAARTPPVWLRPGDTVTVDLGPIGRLSNPVSS